jgi:hypothetical protein
MGTPQKHGVHVNSKNTLKIVYTWGIPKMNNHYLPFNNFAKKLFRLLA